ncbi:DNA-binding LytR/AlgR family response regulator [Lactobacillus colini]|uniref:DNA-binding LytR/AlgR family response regulator n=1 Tax=Lactobacillus colini TaxID=1819254 RepID=A0ABS4MBE9_9LACO|nr:LytTR family DNA-binding domain-containing protein [Lactobacillus colini]MBP2056938.1 DNA-binding LytR/AlgR family response regulator [Lactobacillus colini]
MRIAIVEDNQDELNRLLGCFKQYERENHIKFDIVTFNDGFDLIIHYTENYDAIYLDVQMPKMDGMTTAKKIRKHDKNVLIVFVTNYVQYAIEGYQVNASDFLLKPVSYFNFSEHFKRINQNFQSKQESIMFNTLQGLKKVYLDSLYYVESEKHYLHLHLITDKEEQLDMLDTTKKMEEILTPHNFFRCNNGYIVNLKHISEVNGNIVKVGPYDLQISRPRKKAFMQALTEFLGSSDS